MSEAVFLALAHAPASAVPQSARPVVLLVRVSGGLGDRVSEEGEAVMGESIDDEERAALSAHLDEYGRREIAEWIVDCWEQDFIADPEGVRNLSNLVDSIRPARMDKAREN